MVKFYVRHGLVVEKIREIISLGQSKCLEKKNKFNTHKRNLAEKDFEKTSTIYSITHSMKKQWKTFVVE